MATPTLPGTAPEQVYLGKYSGKFMLSAAVFTLAAVAGVALLTNAFTAHDFNATVPGTLDDNYTQVTHTQNGAVTSTDYEVTYTFNLDGRQYKGKDTLSVEPQDANCTVYYMKNNPADNALKTGHVDSTLRNYGIACLALALIAYLWMHFKGLAKATATSQLSVATNQYSVGPPSPAEASQHYGDAAGEHTRIRHGKYAAWLHVHIAFFAQIAALGLILALLLSHYGGATMTQTRAFGIAAAVAILFTLWEYFDRWRCIEAVASKSCSGVVNLSFFYVPIVAAVYANYRGLRKLAGK